MSGTKAALSALRCSWAVLLPLLAAQEAVAASGSDGITVPQKFPPFVADAAACSAPPAMKPILVFAQDNERDFMKGVSQGLAKAAHDRGLAYAVDLAGNDVAKMVAQIKVRVADHTGAVVVAPIDPGLTKKSLQELIWSGSYVGTIVPPPAVTLLNAPQYLTGKTLADAAVDYINQTLGGHANVVLLTHDNLQFLAPRFTAMRDVLGQIPGVTIVADITPGTIDRHGGFDTMNTILLANPEIDVVLGADTVVLGALDALRAAGKARPEQFLGGIDGEADAVAEIKKKDSPYKASISLASPIFGFAMGQQAADWLQGKSVPQAMDILPVALTQNNLAQYQADVSDPAEVYADPKRRDSYLKMYGNICYDTRDRYVNFPWSSEQ